MKTEEKKREAARPKTNGSTPTTPAQETPTPTPTQAQTQTQAQSQAPNEPHPTDTATPAQDIPEPQAAEAVAPSTVIESIESSTNDPKPDVDVDVQPSQVSHSNLCFGDSGLHLTTLQDAPTNGELPTGDEESKAVVPDGREGREGPISEETAQENDEGGDDTDQPAQTGMGPGFDSMNGNFGMNFANGDVNQMQMQMMLAMQNGMNPATFGSLPMMGKKLSHSARYKSSAADSTYAGMMDPMTMQSMMMNGGFGAQGMGMNGMNMNMGMNGFNGGGNDWNGQQSWNVTQDNFNPNAPGMGNGEFGNFNNGFRAGFNQGNYGHHNQFNDYHRGNRGFRGRGRGRGFYGGYSRGGYQQGYNNNNANAGWAGQGSQISGGRDGQPALDNTQGAGQVSGNVDEFGRAMRSESVQEVHKAGENEHVEAGGNRDSTAADGTDKLALEDSEHVPKKEGSQSAQGDPTNDKGDVSSRDQHSAPQGPSRGSAGPIHLQTAIPDVPFNAPTGPKAMRQGLPNTSLHHLRARGLITDETSPTSRTNPAPIVASPVEDKVRSRSSSLHSSKDKDRRPRERDREHDEDEKSRGRPRDTDRDRSRTGSKSRSRSRSRDRKETRKHRRHRSPSVPDNERDSDPRRRSHKSRRQSTREDDNYSRRPREEKHEERSRSASPAGREHKRSSHRDRRDRDEKRRDRDRDVDRDSDYDRHRKPGGHRSHRDRDQGRERDREREKERDRDRARDRDEDRHYRSSKNSSALPTPVEPSGKTFNPPTGPRGGFSIKGASNKPASIGLEIKGASSRPSHSNRRESGPSRRDSQVSGAGHKSTSNVPMKDPHQLEREARDRERLLKETQRMAAITGRGGGVKRSRESGDDRGGSRRKSRRSEAVNGEDEEGRMRRLEAEREGRRWD